MYTATHLSILADLILGTILIFLWVVRHDDRHALYLGVAQIMVGFATAIWSLKMPGGVALSSICCIVGASGFIAGIQHFGSRPPHWVANLLGWSLFFLIATQVPVNGKPLAYTTIPIAFTATCAWAAWRLLQRQHPYRVLGLLFALRALSNAALVICVIRGEGLDALLLLFFVLKVASTFGLIHAFLEESYERFRMTLNNLGNGVLIRDATGSIRYASQKMADWLGLADARTLLGKNVASLTPHLPKEYFTEWFEHVTSPDTPKPCITEETYTQPDGSLLPLELISIPYQERGQTMLLTQFMDIRERKAQEAALQRAATLDEATGLFSRGALRQMLSGLLVDTATSGRPVALLLIDIDHFRRVNETLGHSVGDRLLQQITARLKTLQGPHDILARFGGDEFAFVLPDVDPADPAGVAEHFAQRILQELRPPFPFSQFQIVLKASIGIAFGPAHGLDPESLLSAADIALYAAKDAGRDRYCFFDEKMGERSRDTMMIDEALQQAIPRNEFHLVYQPIVEARSRRLCKVEALLRWTSPTLGFVGPDRFVPIAEESGLIVDIGNWVLQEAARQARIWADEAGGSIRIAINVAAAQLVAPNFLSVIDETLARSGAAPTDIEIEMTERVLINEADTVVHVIEALHAKGMSTSLDDFGTGYSSLSYLTRFHLRTLKIDRAFVNGVEHDARKLALVRAIIAMGHSLGMEIVAEGVETEAQAGVLTDLGCQYLQGWLISRPVPPEKVRAD